MKPAEPASRPKVIPASDREHLGTVLFGLWMTLAEGLTSFSRPAESAPPARAYGLDMTDEMLDLARRNAAEADVNNVEFLKGHIESIPLPDATVDVVISNCVIQPLRGQGQRAQRSGKGPAARRALRRK